MPTYLENIDLKHFVLFILVLVHLCGSFLNVHTQNKKVVTYILNYKADSDTR